MEWKRQRDCFLMPSPKMHKSRADGINVRTQAHQSKEPSEMKERDLLKWEREKQHVYSVLGSLKKKRNKRATAKKKNVFNYCTR